MLQENNCSKDLVQLVFNEDSKATIISVALLLLLLLIVILGIVAVVVVLS